ncbi:hypothetical protein, partial [Streptomyces sp. NPDC058418]|uniref:hypothetical protein n=1 Tax=Streptomyces sp. NPDC058418 TaxID=3346488 RepID=UPI003656E2E4
VMDGFMTGINDQVPMLRRELEGITMDLPSSLGFTDARAFGFTGQITQPAPTVLVSIGGEAVDQYVDVRIDRSNRTRDRIAAQGVRF